MDSRYIDLFMILSLNLIVIMNIINNNKPKGPKGVC